MPTRTPPRRWRATGVVEAPVDEVFEQLLTAGIIPPGADRATARSAAVDADGRERFRAPIGDPPVTSVDVEIDRTARTLAVQGHWWYRGVYAVQPHPRGSRIVYQVHNIAPNASRWVVPLMQFRLASQMRGELDQLLHTIGARLGGASDPVAN